MRSFKQWLNEVREMPGKRRSKSWSKQDEKEHEPLRDSDTVRLYHGFRDFHLALRAIQKGISGQELVGRVYSYENNNNPKGLFVSTEMEVAKEFSSAYGVAVIIEFHCKAKDLEAPVWPNGSYTVQGQMSGMFHSDDERENQRMKEREETLKAKHVQDHIKKSDRPELASTLMASREFQALFMGHLDPNMIRAVWVREPDEKGYQSMSRSFERITRQTFISKYGKTPIKWGYEDDYEYRAFKPNDTWNADKFLKTMAAKLYAKGHVPEDPIEAIIDGIKYMSDSQLLRYVWPKQYKDAVDWKHKISPN